MQEQLKALLERRCKRSIGVILGVCEREIYDKLTETERKKLRKVVIDVLNDYQGMTLDIMESLDTGDVILNERWLDKIDEIHRTIVAGRDPAPAPIPMAVNGHRSPSNFGGGRPVTPS
jgi:hypothetical protein